MLLKHLAVRKIDLNKYSGVWLNKKDNTVTFGLWNLSGALVGFQQYKPLADKKYASNPSNMKYFTIAGKIDSYSKLLAFGVELLDVKQPVVFVVEGIFDAVPLHNKNINAIATLSNNPKHLKSWVRSLGYKVVALCEGDEAGQKLANIADESVYLPEGKDPADMSDTWFNNLINTYY